MTDLRGDAHRQYIRRMFGRIAERYDLLNRIMTFGRDHHWRRQLVSQLHLQAGERIIDLGTGTGDLALDILQQQPNALVIAADLTPEMVHIGRSRPGSAHVRWVIADADHLPFKTSSFDALISGFLLRNLGELPRSLVEQRRVLRTEGRWAALDTTPPANNILKPFINLYLNTVIPIAGSLLTGDRDAYRYLPASTQAFLPPAAMLAALSRAGFQQPAFSLRMLGTIALYTARKA